MQSWWYASKTLRWSNHFPESSTLGMYSKEIIRVNEYLGTHARAMISLQYII